MPPKQHMHFGELENTKYTEARDAEPRSRRCGIRNEQIEISAPPE